MPSLVLLPGMDGTGMLFAPFVQALGDRMAVHIVRYPPGHPPGCAALADHALAALPPQGDVVVLGESFSGPVAIALADRLPQRVKALVLCGSFARNPRPGLAWLRGLLGRVPSRGLPLPMPLLGRALMGRFGTAALREMLAEAMAQVGKPVLQSRLLAVMTADATPALRRLQMPVLVLQASEDRVVPAGAARQVLQACPHARLQILRGPHFLLQTQPALAAKAVCSFLHDIMNAGASA